MLSEGDEGVEGLAELITQPGNRIWFRRVRRGLLKV
jgi:hypothetical protein